MTTPSAPGETCGCCTFGNHTEPCTCDGSNCCHPEKHRPARSDYQRTEGGVMSNRVYQPGEPKDRWELGMFQERHLIADVDEPTWEQFAAAYNAYYGCSERSTIRLHVDEDGRAYTIPEEAS